MLLHELQRLLDSVFRDKSIGVEEEHIFAQALPNSNIISPGKT